MRSIEIYKVGIINTEQNKTGKVFLNNFLVGLLRIDKGISFQ